MSWKQTYLSTEVSSLELIALNWGFNWETQLLHEFLKFLQTRTHVAPCGSIFKNISAWLLWMSLGPNNHPSPCNPTKNLNGVKNKESSKTPPPPLATITEKTTQTKHQRVYLSHGKSSHKITVSSNLVRLQLLIEHKYIMIKTVWWVTISSSLQQIAKTATNWAFPNACPTLEEVSRRSQKHLKWWDPTFWCKCSGLDPFPWLRPLWPSVNRQLDSLSQGILLGPSLSTIPRYLRSLITVKKAQISFQSPLDYWVCIFMGNSKCGTSI